MTEAEWLAGIDPVPMIEYLHGKASNRKLRLFLVASARLVWDWVPVGRARDGVERAERYADGLETIQEIDLDRHYYYRLLADRVTSENRDWIRSTGDYLVYNLVRHASYSDRMVQTLSTNSNWRESIRRIHPQLPPFLRDIFGNPFRPTTLDPSWLTSTVLALASGIYNERAFDRMPILADALEDAGCDNSDILRHCRQPGEHVRGCWVVDLITGRV